MSSQAEKTAYIGIFTALSIVISILESFFPMPVPGLKLGVANVVTIYILFYPGTKESFLSLFCRCIICSILFGSVTSFAFSLAGGLMSLSISAIIKKKCPTFFSFVGICVLGAAMHNTTQTAVCCLMLGSFAPLSYLPILLVGSVICGIVTGSILNLIPKGLFHAPRS